MTGIGHFLQFVRHIRSNVLDIHTVLISFLDKQMFTNYTNIVD